MKILAFTDIHGSLQALKRIGQKVEFQNPDLLVCTGDISIFEHGISGIIKKLSSFDKKLVIVHGNHEYASTFAKYSKIYKNVIFIHKNHVFVDNVLFLGYGGEGFLTVDREFEKVAAKKFKKIIKGSAGKKIVLLTHAPPYRTSLDKLVGRHCGNKSIRNFAEKNKLDLLVCGHLHENFGKSDKIGNARVVNPGPFGKILVV